MFVTSLISLKLKWRERNHSFLFMCFLYSHSLSTFICNTHVKVLLSFDFLFLLYCFKTNKNYFMPFLYSNALVTFENSPFSSFVCQKIGFVSMKPCLTQPASLTWYKLMYPPE